MNHQGPKLTIGKFLKHLRESKIIKHKKRHKQMSQFDLASRFNWDSSSPVSAIENDSRVPKPETIEKWIEETSQDQTDLVYAYGLAGYLPQTKIPNLSFVKFILDRVSQEIANEVYPAYVLDCYGTFWVMNSLNLALTAGIPLADFMQIRTNVLDLSFNPRFQPLRDKIDNLNLFQAEQLRRYKGVQLLRQHEPFYTNLPASMKDRFSTNFPEFERVWHQTEGLKLSDKTLASGFQWSLLLDNNTKLYFRTSATLIFHLSSSFHIVRHEPFNSPDVPDNQSRIDD